MEQSTREDAGRRTVRAARRAVRVLLGLGAPARALDDADLAAHGTWQVCGVSGVSGASGAGGLGGAGGSPGNGPAGLRRR